ncbi:MAG TPA: hypothetical protein VHB54_03045 [Mucilaginibacter sp.]|nr:hypothetical protein [Mucilaginibacter sp.]
MKKNLIILCFLSSLLSCDVPQTNQSNITQIRLRKIDPILQQLEKKFPNYKDNQIVRDNAADYLQHKIDSVVPLGYLNDIPLKVFRIGKNPHGKGALVQFYSDNYDSNESTRLSDRLNFDIIGFMNEKLATTLKENGKYFVYGKKLKRLTETETFLIVNQVYYSPETKISKNAIWDVYNFYVGDLICEVDSVK